MGSEKGNEEIPIRAVVRTINILKALNRNEAMTMAEISRAVDLPYPTASRFVQTLLEIGVVEKTEYKKKYRPTIMTKMLSCGYRSSDRLVEIARPYLMALTKETGWPAVVNARVGASMVMLDSTHSSTTLTFSEYYPGYTLPLNASAAGLAYLAYAEQSQREEILSHLDSDVLSNGEKYIPREQSAEFLQDIREVGYSTYCKNPHSKDPGKSSSIGVPLISKNEIVGVMTIVFFSSALKIEEAAEKYAGLLIEKQNKINAALEAENITE